MTVETHEFQAEARQLLDLVVHSIYSNKDIFLRELLSNSSDALDKLRLEGLVHPELGADLSDLHIRLEADPEQRTLKVIDNGVGMTREEVRNLIGTIARSGTAEFLRKLRESRDQGASAEMIGQFGVGFYSVFMVADRVTLETRRPGQASGTRWESSGEGTYTLEDVEGPAQGTVVTLHLKPADSEDGLADYTSEWVLRGLVKRYSDFLAHPIRMQVRQGEATEDATLNSMKALWARPTDEVKPEEYHEFYRHVAHDWTDPLETIPMKGEGTFEFQALLFIPSKAPLDLFVPDARRGVQLYVKRVFIMDRCEELLPDHLRFMRGVVDAQDLSLNVSREILQQDRQIRAIRKGLTRKVTATLKEMKENRSETYRTFWNEFGRVLKEGLFREPEQQSALLELCLLPSTESSEPTTLADYVSRMKPEQEAIYYLTGENRSVLENSPHLEAFRQKGYEVLLLQDAVDAVWVEQVADFQGKPFRSASRGSLELGSEDEKKEAESRLEEQRKELASLLAWLGTRLSEQVKQVQLSSRLTTSPACLVSDAHDPSPAMEKLMKAMGQELPPVKRILEINPTHPVVQRLHALYSEKGDEPFLGQAAEMLHAQALLAEGGELPDPSRFSHHLADLMARALG